MNEDINKYISPVKTGLEYMIEQLNKQKASKSNTELLDVATSDLECINQALAILNGERIPVFNTGIK
ncbi:hypothetical protein [Companilactobacillus kedongensis]|uniref:hypothetical protein n=1 Tax=Companilactobacillus kedongensis TaxID=2486004 RepID=UPI000F778D67|nr:hypothetical protein [Companilactobacillus kedongensis]